MNRYLYRVQYTLTSRVTGNSHSTDEKHCIRAETEAAALAEVDEATERYTAAVGASKSITLLDTVAE